MESRSARFCRHATFRELKDAMSKRHTKGRTLRGSIACRSKRAPLCVAAKHAGQTRDGHRRESAFTLIELLVVVSIIALLISILLPSLSKAKERARAVACAANLQQIGVALGCYLHENRHYPGHHIVSPGTWI